MEVEGSSILQVLGMAVGLPCTLIFDR